MRALSISLFALILASPGFADAKPKQKSTITFGRSDSLRAKPGKKRNFKQDVEAIMASHESWKKAHLNTALYSCQRNAEQVAKLARQVSDKIEASAKETTKTARSLEKTVLLAIGENETEVPEHLSFEKRELFKEKLKQLDTARKQAEVLEHLSSQVMNYYLKDTPKVSAVDGTCMTSYPAALKKGVAASQQYHADAFALNDKLQKLSKLVVAALKKASYQVAQK